MMERRTAGYGDRSRWDDFVQSQPGAGPYQLFAWKQAIEDAYGHKTYYLIAEHSGGSICGVLPLVLIKPPLLRGSLVSLPFCDYGGILARDDAAKRDLSQSAYALAKSLHVRLEIRCKDKEPGLNAIPLDEVHTPKSRMLLELPASAAQLWDGFKSKLRSQIKKPAKDGFRFQLGHRDVLEAFFRVFSRNMHDLGSPTHARRWFEAILDAFGDRARLGVVYKGDIPAAAGMILMCRETVTIPWASALREFNSSSPNMLLYWGFLEYASDHGFNRFDFGRSTPGEGTYRFKEQWGARPMPLAWYTGISGINPQPALTAGSIRQHIESVWSNLPVSLTNMIGPRVRKYITL